jgi:hypothetical protein
MNHRHCVRMDKMREAKEIRVHAVHVVVVPVVILKVAILVLGQGTGAVFSHVVQVLTRVEDVYRHFLIHFKILREQKYKNH